MRIEFFRLAMAALAAASVVQSGNGLAYGGMLSGDGPSQFTSGVEIAAPSSGGNSCFVSATITPNVSLPDGDPNFTCFDMTLTAPPSAVVTDVEVVVGHDHTWVGDLIYQIWNPQGDHVTMMHRPGRSGAGFGDSSNLLATWPITFGDAYAEDAETMGNTIDGSSVVCRDDNRCAYFPNPDEDLTSLVGFAGLAGAAAAGTWQFCASDNSSGDVGSLELVKLNVACSAPPQPGDCDIGDWQSVASVNTARSRVGLTYSPVTGKFYLLGGEGSGLDRDIPIEEYDPQADTWTDKSHLSVGVSNTGAATVGDYIYVPGGYTGAQGIDDMQRYDPVTDKVTTMSPMPGANHAHAVTALDGRVYVLGGSPVGQTGTTVYIYIVELNLWAIGAPLPTAVNYPAATTDGRFIYVIGGNTNNLATVQRYDPVANNWDTVSEMGAGRGGAAAFFDGFNIWAVGGGWSSYLTSTEYGRGAAWWQGGPALNVGARTLGAAYGGGKALKAGGWSGGAFVDSAELIEISCPDVVFADRFE